MSDIRQLSRAFELMDKDKSGKIKYDLNKITDCNTVNFSEQFKL